MKTNRIIISLFSGAVLLLTGCDEEKYQLKFSHYIHVTDNEMDCDECHGELGEPTFLAISHDTCIDCHDEPEEEEINQETCGYCHQEKQLPELLKYLQKHSVFYARRFKENHINIDNIKTIEDLVKIPDPF